MFLRSQGRFAEAADAFREAVAAQPHTAALHANLATALADAGQLQAAQREYQTALACDPNLASALTGLGSLHVRMGRFAQARECYERVLEHDNADMAAHLAMYEIEQIDGNIPKALWHQRRVLQRNALFSAHAPHEERSLLALMVPGDWQANVPVDFLIDPRTTTLHKLYLLSPRQSAAISVPRARVVFTAIAESDETVEALALASGLIRRIGLPVINHPSKILGTNRVQISQKLKGIPNVHAPETIRVRREMLEGGLRGMKFPIVVRPVGSQAGRDLARLCDDAQLAEYLNRVPADAFYVMPFVDFRAPDGYFRKYRVIIVDGEPYPYHLAISPEWMIHYYNAPMRETPWMREEEAFFLAHFEQVFQEPLQRALRDIAGAIGLEYVGVDCSIDAQGRLLVFEADPAMIVHAGDDPQLFPYKKPHVQRIFDAFAKLIDRVGSR